MRRQLRCYQCKSSILGPTKWDDWQALFRIIEFLHVNGDITEEAMQMMHDLLLSFKSEAEDEPDE